jgi:hypothetical protein
MSSVPEFLSGYLLITPNPHGLRQLLVEAIRLRPSGEFISSGWDKFVFNSRKPLLNEDIVTGTSRESYSYPIFLRMSDRRFLLTSIAREIIDHILLVVVPGISSAAVYRVNFAVQRLIEKIVSATTDYSLTFVHARTPNYGNHLKAISFYGDDLVDAQFFKDALTSIRGYSCGICYAPNGPEIVSVRRSGQVSFAIPVSSSLDRQQKRLADVERLLKFLRDNELIIEPDLLAPSDH